MKIRTLLIVLGICAIAFGGLVLKTQYHSTNLASEWKVYKNEKFGFSFQYPPSFKFDSEEDWSDNPDIINPGYLVRFIGSDKETSFAFKLDLASNPLKETDEAQLDGLLRDINSLKTEDQIGKTYANKVIVNGVTYLDWGITAGDYSYATYQGNESYEFLIFKPKIYDKSTYKISEYKKGILSDVDARRIVESFTRR